MPTVYEYSNHNGQGKRPTASLYLCGNLDKGAKGLDILTHLTDVNPLVRSEVGSDADTL